jgi:hypothetical protein
MESKPPEQEPPPEPRERWVAVTDEHGLGRVVVERDGVLDKDGVIKAAHLVEPAPAVPTAAGNGDVLAQVEIYGLETDLLPHRRQASAADLSGGGVGMAPEESLDHSRLAAAADDGTVRRGRCPEPLIPRYKH